MNICLVFLYIAYGTQTIMFDLSRKFMSKTIPILLPQQLKAVSTIVDTMSKFKITGLLPQHLKYCLRERKKNSYPFRSLHFSKHYMIFSEQISMSFSQENPKLSRSLFASCSNPPFQITVYWTFQVQSLSRKTSFYL